MKKLILLALVVLFIGCSPAAKNSARIYIDQREYDKAKEQILIGLQETPDDYELYCLLMKAEIGLGDWNRVSKAFQDGIKVDSVKAVNWMLKDKNNIPIFKQAFYNAAVGLMDDEEYDGALRNLKFCKILEPEDVNVYILEGGIYDKLGNKELASQVYDKALSIDPENPDAYFLIGKALFDKKSYDSCLVRFNGAIKYYEIKYKRITKVIFQNLSEFDKDLAQKIIKLSRGKKKDELDELVKVKLGIDAGLNAMQGNINKFYKTTDGLSQTYYRMGMAHYNLNNDSLALVNLFKSLEFMPDDSDALFYAGELLIKTEKYQEAINYFGKLTQLKDDDFYAWFYIAVCWTQLKEYKKAAGIYEDKVLVSDPKNIDAMTNLAYIYREMGNNKKSFEYLMKAEKLQKEQ
ncbi:hypothetical protein ES705_07797 [subsurface metagenome]